MNIKKATDLKHGVKYWYVSVTYNCHWTVQVLSFIYDQNNGSSSLWDMLIFTDEKSAKNLANRIENLIKPYKII